MAVKKRKLKSTLRSIGFYLALIVITALSVVLIRVFAFAVFTIPSNSMSPSILTGDKIFVNKLLFGARIFDIFNPSNEARIIRAKGIREIKRNDVLVFNFPHKNKWDKIEMDMNQHYVKRCVGLPGDTFEIENGFFKVLNSTDTVGLLSSQRRMYQTSEKDLKSFGGIYQTFPYDSTHDWDIKNFGPLYIPRKGDTIKISADNFYIYRKLIESETKGMLSKRNNVVYLNSQELDYYIFNSNYYFMAGDNSFDSKDSRYWGMLPENCIVGVVTHIWSSMDPYTGQYRSDRFFKKVK